MAIGRSERGVVEERQRRPVRAPPHWTGSDHHRLERRRESVPGAPYDQSGPTSRLHVGMTLPDESRRGSGGQVVAGPHDPKYNRSALCNILLPLLPSAAILLPLWRNPEAHMRKSFALN